MSRTSRPSVWLGPPEAKAPNDFLRGCQSSYEARARVGLPPEATERPETVSRGEAAFSILQCIHEDYGARTAILWAANLAEAMDAPEVAERLRETLR